MKYTIESLSEINHRFLGTHYKLHQSDVDMANKYVELIESTRSETEPRNGDVVRWTDKYGEYSEFAHIEVADGRPGGNVCQHASVYVSESNDKNGIVCSSSGGTWGHIDKHDMKYVGKTQKRFWRFGSYGACADGGIDFYAEVNVWEYVDEELEDRVHTTKDYDRYYIYKIDHRKEKDSIYDYRVSKGGGSGYGCAFETEEDLNAWKKTFRVEETDTETYWGGNMVWAWKQERHGISPDEFESMTEPEDTFLMNGSIRRCKRKYDEENHTVHTYHVWYWGDDWMENSTEQNRVIDSYSLDRTHKEYELARKSA